MKDRTAATHSNHDELLIVRLFGDDVDAPERARALGLLGECKACAALFADLGATADATAALPVPARPRDFALSEADAARLRRARRGAVFLSVLRRTRTLGGSLVAIGLVGIVATASLGILGGTAGSANSLTSRTASQVSLPADGPATTAALAAWGAAAQTSGSPLPAAAPLEESSAASLGRGAQGAAASAGTDSKAVPPPPVPSGQVFGGNAAGSPEVQPLAAATSTGLDSRLVWLGGFGLLFLAGLGVLIAPLVRRRKTR